jgi:hypothetical protein
MTSNIRTNRSLIHDRQPTAVGDRSRRLERTISEQNCLVTKLAILQTVALGDPSPRRRQRMDISAATYLGEGKFRYRLSTGWRVLRR